MQKIDLTNNSKNLEHRHCPPRFAKLLTSDHYVLCLDPNITIAGEGCFAVGFKARHPDSLRGMEHRMPSLSGEKPKYCDEMVMSRGQQEEMGTEEQTATGEPPFHFVPCAA